MKRSQAEKLIDKLRELAAGDHAPTLEELRDILYIQHRLAPLQRCTGEAHTNAFIDNCHRCAPRWGFVGAKERVT